MAAPARFVILHGWENWRPEGHWQRWLAEALAAEGADVDYPQLPEPDSPVLADWLEELARLIDPARGGSVTVVAHSLAVLLWLQHAQRRGPDDPVVERVLLVSPPDPAVLADPLPDFAAVELDGDRLRAASKTPPQIVCSDDDPYCPEVATTVYAPLGLDTAVYPGAGHFAPDDGYGAWPAVLAWAKGDARAFQWQQP